MAEREKTSREPVSVTGEKIETHNDHNPVDPLLISAPEAAKLLGIGARSLWAWTRCGAIPCRRAGRRVLYVPDELRAWIDAGCPTSPGAGDRIRQAMRREGARR